MNGREDGERQYISVIQDVVEWFIQPYWRAFILIFVLAFTIRFFRLMQVPLEFLTPNPDWELNAIAISLVETGQFADPYLIPTGPTAHLPPVYPFIFSMIYRVFGLTPSAGLATWIFIIISGSLLYALLPWFSNRLGTGSGAGFIGGLAGACMVEWTGHGEYPTAIVLGLFLVSFLGRWTLDQVSWKGSLLLGLAIGAAFHLQPALLPVILGCIAFELFWRRGKRKWMQIGILGVGAVIACVPWAWRNYTTFNALFFIRSNLGLELRMGNHDWAAPTMAEMDAILPPRHPRSHIGEAQKVRDMGEIAYMRQAMGEALDWIAGNPGEFLKLSVGRFINLWAGPPHRPLEALKVCVLTLLALWGAWRTFPRLFIPQRAVFLIPLLTFPVIYYFVAYMPRYRVPIDWILFILAGAGLLGKPAVPSLSEKTANKIRTGA